MHNILTETVMLIVFKLCLFTIVRVIAVRLFSEAVFVFAQASPSSCFMASGYMATRSTLRLPYSFLPNITGYLDLPVKENLCMDKRVIRNNRACKVSY